MGELEKRINEKSACYLIKDNQEECILTSDVFQFLDEARREFPNYAKWNLLQQFKDGDTWIPEDFPSMEFSKDVICWFIRQFGVGEVKKKDE